MPFRLAPHVRAPARSGRAGLARLAARMLAAAAACLPLLAGQACASRQGAVEHLARKGAPPPRLERFRVCSGFACQRMADVSLTPDEWARVRALFAPQPASAAAERERAALAVGLLERLAGARAGTDRDLPRNLRDENHFQLDCIAEAFNTTTYLLLLAEGGLLPRHEVGAPAHRGPLDLAAWHNSAVLVERATGRGYAVDSWFEGAGEAARVVSLEQWTAGWEPAP